MVWWLILIAIIAISMVVFFLFKRRKKHWQEGYIMVRTNKPGPSKTQESGDTPVWDPTIPDSYREESKSDDEVTIPPGMF